MNRYKYLLSDRNRYCTGCGHPSNNLNENNYCPQCVRAEIRMSRVPNQAQPHRIKSIEPVRSSGDRRYELSYVTKFGIRAVLRFDSSDVGKAWGKFNTLQEKRAMGLKLYDTKEDSILGEHNGTNKI